jgi:carbamoyl-phosphate synthase small subunit
MTTREVSIPALLVLEDGSAFEGRALGAQGTAYGEICFNTSMTGYQEVLTDPSYHGQIVCLTAAQVGNTGVNGHDDQSDRAWAAGLVVREASRSFSSWRASGSLHDYLRARNVVGIEEVDTRRLTRHIRSLGTMRAALTTEVLDPGEAVDLVRRSPAYEGRDLASEVSTASPYSWGAGDLARRAGAVGALGPTLVDAPGPGDRRFRVAALDFGVKHNLLDLLAAARCDVTVLPASSGASEILSGGFDGVFLSNGPGDPAPLQHAVATVKSLLGRVPIFGICLGHQLLARALGADTFKLPFGHRGANHPVRFLDTGRVEITSQNHGFAVDADSLARTSARLTHVNLNDGTVEGLEVPGRALSVQYHPEAGPGPHDARYLFGRWRALLAGFEADVAERLDWATTA